MITYQIEGALVGKIWMPAVEAQKPLSYRFVRYGHEKLTPFTNVHETLREAALAATNDGDFQDCDFTADTVLVITKVSGKHTRIIREKVIDLFRFPSIEDLVSGTYRNIEDW